MQPKIIQKIGRKKAQNTQNESGNIQGL